MYTCIYQISHTYTHTDDPEFWDRVLSSQECSSSSHHNEPGTNSGKSKQMSGEGDGPQSKRFKSSQ